MRISIHLFTFVRSARPRDSSDPLQTHLPLVHSPVSPRQPRRQYFDPLPRVLYHRFAGRWPREPVMGSHLLRLGRARWRQGQSSQCHHPRRRTPGLGAGRGHWYDAQRTLGNHGAKGCGGECQGHGSDGEDRQRWRCRIGERQGQGRRKRHSRCRRDRTSAGVWEGRG